MFLQSVSAPFYSLIQAMVEKNVVAIVEKIYRRNTEANMVALFPSVDDPNEPWVKIFFTLFLIANWNNHTQAEINIFNRASSKSVYRSSETMAR